jgi:diguanylate cyclase (GGDEF)-like protein
MGQRAAFPRLFACAPQYGGMPIGEKALHKFSIAGSSDDADSAIQRLANQSLVDSVTGLPNRALFLDRLNQTLSFARREDWIAALLLVDLPSVGRIGAGHDQAAADQLLRETATRLRAIARESDSIARIDNNRFAILLPTGASLPGAIMVADRIVSALSEPHRHDGHDIVPAVHVGIALYPKHADSADTLFDNAATAATAAEDAAQTNQSYLAYSGNVTNGSGATQRQQISLTENLRSADANEFILHFQPIVSFKSERIVGFEALARWLHPREGLLIPDLFIPLAEQTGRIEAITEWVVAQALHQCHVWCETGLEVPVSINLFPLTLHNPSFPDEIATALDRWEVPPEMLMLEITESAIISDVARATETLNRLHDMGVRVWIDDFGSGYTSLSYIRRLPVSGIKVDKSFTAQMSEVNDDAAIVRSIVDLGRNLGLRVVAEGIEDRETWNLLAEFGCDEAQGFYISRPLKAEEITDWARNRT